MKSIVYVTTAFPTQTFFLENEIHRLLARGVRVRVLRLRGRGSNVQPEHRVLESVTTSVGSPIAWRSWLALLGWLVRRPHVLVPEFLRMVWASRGSLYALAGHVGYLPAAARVASVVEAEDLERIHGGWAHFPGSVGYLAARLTGRPFSMAAHAGSDLYRTQAFLAEKVRAADFTAACVRGNADMLRALAGPGARVEWIYHGVDLRRFDGAGRARAPEPLFVTVGRLHEGKGYDVAIRVLAAIRSQGFPAHLVLVGDGPERARLESLAASLGLAGAVAFRGALPQREILPLYRGAWMLLAPSRVLANGRRDGIPNVIVEAMAMGVPVAGTQAAGLEEAVTHGVTGTLTPPEDVGAMAAAIVSLLREPAALDRLGDAARARVGEGFDVECNFERMYALLARTATVAPWPGPAPGGSR